MWLGLRDQERVLTPPEAKVVQKVQSTDTYGYLLLAVDPLRGEFRWQCVERMRAEHLLPVP